MKHVLENHGNLADNQRYEERCLSGFPGGCGINSFMSSTVGQFSSSPLLPRLACEGLGLFFPFIKKVFLFCFKLYSSLGWLDNNFLNFTMGY